MNKKLAVFLIAVLFCMVIGAGTAAAQTPLTGEWYTYSDSSEGGASRDQLIEATETIGGRSMTTYTLRGTRATSAAIQWPYVGLGVRPDATARAALNNSRGISFRVVGDGRPYVLEASLSTVTDWAHYSFSFNTVNGQERHITILWDQFQQPSDWGARVPFTRQHITNFQWVASQQVLGNVNIKVYDVQILR